jgi:hypothetical protein
VNATGRALPLTLAALFSGCAGGPDVLDIGNNNYSLTAHAQIDTASSRQEAVDAAKEFCAKQSKSAVISSFSDSGPELFKGYTTSVIFTCRSAR